MRGSNLKWSLHVEVSTVFFFLLLSGSLNSDWSGQEANAVAIFLVLGRQCHFLQNETKSIFIGPQYGVRRKPQYGVRRKQYRGRRFPAATSIPKLKLSEIYKIHSNWTDFT
jgi:hypothetical protein